VPRDRPSAKRVVEVVTNELNSLSSSPANSWVGLCIELVSCTLIECKQLVVTRFWEARGWWHHIAAACSDSPEFLGRMRRSTTHRPRDIAWWIVTTYPYLAAVTILCNDITSTSHMTKSMDMDRTSRRYKSVAQPLYGSISQMFLSWISRLFTFKGVWPKTDSKWVDLSKAPSCRTSSEAVWPFERVLGRVEDLTAFVTKESTYPIARGSISDVWKCKWAHEDSHSVRLVLFVHRFCYI